MKKETSAKSKVRKRVQPAGKASVNVCPPGMRPAVWNALQETMTKRDALYRALAKSGG